MINGAIIRMFKESQLGLDLLNEMANGPVIPNSLNWSTDLYQKVRKYNKNWTIFPCGFFNTEWQIHLSDTEKKDSKFKTLYDFIRFPFKKNPLSGEMYNGVFSWHWHNGWNEKIEEGCKWELLESKFNKLTYEKFKIKNL